MLNKLIHQIPFIRLFIPFVIGLVTALCLAGSISSVLLLYILSTCIIIAILLKPITKNRFNIEWINSLWHHIVLFLIGFTIVNIRKSEIVQNLDKEVQHQCIGHVFSEPEEKEKTYKIILELESIKKDAWQPISGKIIAYLEKDISIETIGIGDKFIFSAYMQSPATPKNPGQFNYKKYLYYHGIGLQTYIKSGNWKILEKQSKYRIKYYSNKVRRHLLQQYREHNITDSEFAVLAALSLGYKEELDTELKDSYAATGAMHILAVSGLHVGVIFLVLSKLLFFLDNGRKRKIVKATIIILLLVFYAFISGLSPSISRATLMLSLVVAGKAFNKSINVYNSILASAFILLMIDPFFITYVGFQLSYLAVIGIVYFHDKLYSSLKIKNWFLDKIWLMFCVSLAAQLATFPLSLYYFNQFPNYFFVTNLIVLPLVSVVIYSSMVFFLFSAIAPVADIIGYFLKYLIKSLNFIIAFIQEIPFSVTKNIYLNVFQISSLFVSMIAVSLFLELKRKAIMYLTLCSFLILAISVFYRQLQVRISNKFIVHSVKGYSVFNIVKGKNSYLLANEDFFAQKKSIDFNVNPTILKLGAKKIVEVKVQNAKSNLYQAIMDESIFIKKENGVIFLTKEKEKIAIIDSLEMTEAKEPISVDILVLKAADVVDLELIINLFHPGKIILDSSFGYYELKKMKEKLEVWKLDYYAVNDKGAFVL